MHLKKKKGNLFLLVENVFSFFLKNLIFSVITLWVNVRYVAQVCSNVLSFQNSLLQGLAKYFNIFTAGLSPIQPINNQGCVSDNGKQWRMLIHMVTIHYSSTSDTHTSTLCTYISRWYLYKKINKIKIVPAWRLG